MGAGKKNLQKGAYGNRGGREINDHVWQHDINKNALYMCVSDF